MPNAKRWNDGTFYGRKTKRYFVYLDRLIIKMFKQLLTDDIPINNDQLDKLLKMTGRQNTLAHTITKLVETLDTNQRLLDIERLINSIPPDAIAKAREIDSIVTR